MYSISTVSSVSVEVVNKIAFGKKNKQKHENEVTYLSCAVFTSNALDISVSTRKTNSSVFLVLMFMLMLIALSVKTACTREISGFVPVMFLLMLTFMSRLFSLVLMPVLIL